MVIGTDNREQWEATSPCYWWICICHWYEAHLESIIDYFTPINRLIFMLIYSVKSNNLKLFHKCNGEMANLFFAFDGPNYSRYLVWLEVFLSNIDLSHPGAKELLEKGGTVLQLHGHSFLVHSVQLTTRWRRHS